MDFRSLLNKIAEAEAPLPGAGQKGPTVAAAAGKDPSNPLNKSAGQAAQPVAAEWKPTPEQEKWLGGADRQDPYVLNRMPGDKPPVSYFKDPADQATAKQMGFPEAPKAPSTTGQGAQPAAKSTTQQKIEKLNQLVDKLVALRQAPAQEKSQPAPSEPAAGQAAQPAKVSQDADGTFTYQKKDGTVLKLDANGKVLSESPIAKDLVESFGYTVNEAELSMKQLGGGLASGAAKAGLAKAGAKTAAKLVPGAGSALSAMDAYNRWQEGDRSGAVIAALAGIGWLVPGPMGWVLGGSLDAANIARDFNKPDSNEPEDKPTTSKADPKIIALQKFLKNQGADLGTTGPEKDGVDGIMGPKTRAAMDTIGLSESQRAQLAQMLSEAGVPLSTLFKQAGALSHNLPSVLRTGGETWRAVPGVAGKFINSAGKVADYSTIAKSGSTVADVAKTVGQTAGKAGSRALDIGKTVGRTIAKHPYATAAGVGAAGLAALGGGDVPSSTTNVPAGKPGSPSANIAAQAAQPKSAEWTDEQKELNRQIKDIAQDLQISANNDPAVKAALDAAGKKMAGINQSFGQAAQPEKSSAPVNKIPSLADWESKIGSYK